MGNDIPVSVSTVVREDAFALRIYRVGQREAFELLRGVSRIGPKCHGHALYACRSKSSRRRFRPATRGHRQGGVSKARRAHLPRLQDSIPARSCGPRHSSRRAAADQLPLALARLGYRKSEIDRVMADPSVPDYGEQAVEERLRACLRLLGRLLPAGSHLVSSHRSHRLRRPGPPTAEPRRIRRSKAGRETSCLPPGRQGAGRCARPHALAVRPAWAGLARPHHRRRLGVDIRPTSGPWWSVAATLRPSSWSGWREVLFIDEIHRLNRAVEEVLSAVKTRIDIALGRGPGAQSVSMPLSRFTLVGACCPRACSPGAARRFQIHFNLQFCRSTSWRRSSGAVPTGWGSPSRPMLPVLAVAVAALVANRLLRRTRGTAEVEGDGSVDVSIVDLALGRLGHRR